MIEKEATLEDFKEITKTVFDAFVEHHYNRYKTDIFLSDKLSPKPKYCSQCGNKLHENIGFNFDKTNHYRDNVINMTTWRVCLRCQEEKDMEEQKRNQKLQEELDRIEKEKAELKKF